MGPRHLIGDIIAIGDIHGQLTKLISLWRQLEKFPTSTPVVFLGDYVDRGPDTKGVLEFLAQLKDHRPNTYFLAGNHEFAMMGFLGLLPRPADSRWSFEETWRTFKPWKGAMDALWEGPTDVIKNMHLQGRRWGNGLVYESSTVFKSYGVPEGDREALLKAIPNHHIDFLSALDFVVESENYIFVHAGLEAHKPLDEQLEKLHARDCTEPFIEALSGRSWGKPHPQLTRTVVCGHVFTPTVNITDRRIMIDTTGGTDGPSTRLSAVVLGPNTERPRIIQSGKVGGEAGSPTQGGKRARQRSPSPMTVHKRRSPSPGRKAVGTTS